MPTPKVLKTFGDWAVTPDGVENARHSYYITADRLWEAYPWEDHLAEKIWVNLPHARAALAFARQHFAHLKPKT